MLYAIYPGTVTTYEGETLTLSYEDLIELYGVDPEDCMLGTDIPSNRLIYYILLKPRQDNNYPNMPEAVLLGTDEEHKWGKDFDGRKRFTQETNFDTLYADQEAEQKP